MRATRVLAVCAALLLLSSPAASLSIEVDTGDADYIFGRHPGELRGKYVIARNVFMKAKEYVESVINVQSGLSESSFPSYLDYYTSPKSGRVVNAKRLSSNAFFYFDAYTNAAETNTLTTVYRMTNTTKGRTNACLLSVNLNNVNTSHYAINYTLLTTYVHNFYDCLVMNEDMFSRILNNTDVTNGVTVPTALTRDRFVTNLDYDGGKRNFWTLDQGILPTPNTSIVTFLKSAYRADVSGVLMEDNGDETGYRFENAIYYADVSAPLNTQPKLLTPLIPHLAVATGFYTMIASTTKYQYNPFPAAKTSTAGKLADLDTNFQTKNCLASTALGYCTTENELSCSDDGLYILKCIKDPVDGACMFKAVQEFCTFRKTSGIEAYETYGPLSRCVMVSTSGTSRPACVKINAPTPAGPLLVTNIVIQEGTSSTVTCDGVGNTKTLPVSTSVTVTCPGSPAFLTTYDRSASDNLKDCSGNGIWLYDGSMTPSTGQCFCWLGYSGTSCDTLTDFVSNPIFTDPYNATGLGWVRLDFGGIQAFTAIWAMFTALWLCN